VVEGAYAKNGETAHQPIRPEFATEFARWLRAKPASELLWPGEWHKNAAEMLRVDLEAAGVPFKTRDGVLDFHALRHSYITSLSQCGVSPKRAQELARHSDINLTMNFYTHLKLEEVAAVRATGAHGRWENGAICGISCHMPETGLAVGR